MYDNFCHVYSNFIEFFAQYYLYTNFFRWMLKVTNNKVEKDTRLAGY